MANSAGTAPYFSKLEKLKAGELTKEDRDWVAHHMVGKFETMPLVSKACQDLLVSKGETTFAKRVLSEKEYSIYENLNSLHPNSASREVLKSQLANIGQLKSGLESSVRA